MDTPKCPNCFSVHFDTLATPARIANTPYTIPPYNGHYSSPCMYAHKINRSKYNPALGSFHCIRKSISFLKSFSLNVDKGFTSCYSNQKERQGSLSIAKSILNNSTTNGHHALLSNNVSFDLSLLVQWNLTLCCRFNTTFFCWSNQVTIRL